MYAAQNLYRDLFAVLIAAAILAVLILGLAALVITQTGNRITWWGPAPVLEGYKRTAIETDPLGLWLMVPLASTREAAITGRVNESATTLPQILNLSTVDVRNYFERWVASSGNHHIKVGNVTEKDGNFIFVDIVTTDMGSLAERFLVDRHTGTYRPEE